MLLPRFMPIQPRVSTVRLLPIGGIVTIAWQPNGKMSRILVASPVTVLYEVVSVLVVGAAGSGGGPWVLFHFYRYISWIWHQNFAAG